MAKYTNVVRLKVKPGKQQEFESLFSKADNWEGQLLHILAHRRTKLCGLWPMGK